MTRSHSHLGTTTAKRWSNRLNVQWRDVQRQSPQRSHAAFSRISERAESLPWLCWARGITDRGTTCKACLGDGKLTSAVRGYPSPPCTARRTRDRQADFFPNSTLKTFR